MFSRSLVVACLLVCSSCASIVSKSSWPVNVTTVPAGAEVEITNKSGDTVHKASAPFTVTLESGCGYFSGECYTLKASAPGHATTTPVLDTNMNGWYIGNLLFGGLIGFLIVDPLTGAMFKISDSVCVSLSQTQA